MKTQSDPAINFEIAFKHLIVLEGGYSNDPKDRGGETKYGISRRTYPDLDIANLTLEQARQIYWRDYWCANQCDKLPQPLAVALFDGVVNHRAKTAKQMLQVALGVAGDGVIGSVTIGVATNADAKEVLARYLAARANLYHQIILSDSSQSRFAAGWFRRLFVLQQFIMEKSWPWLP